MTGCVKKYGLVWKRVWYSYRRPIVRVRFLLRFQVSFTNPAQLLKYLLIDGIGVPSSTLEGYPRRKSAIPSPAPQAEALVPPGQVVVPAGCARSRVCTPLKLK